MSGYMVPDRRYADDSVRLGVPKTRLARTPGMRRLAGYPNGGGPAARRVGDTLRGFACGGPTSRRAAGNGVQVRECAAAPAGRIETAAICRLSHRQDSAPLPEPGLDSHPDQPDYKVSLLCRIEDVAAPHTYSLACMSVAVGPIINSVSSSLSRARLPAEYLLRKRRCLSSGDGRRSSNWARHSL
jgi:hypothetical protein